MSSQDEPILTTFTHSGGPHPYHHDQAHGGADHHIEFADADDHQLATPPALSCDSQERR